MSHTALPYMAPQQPQVGDCADHPADISSTAIWEYYSSDGVLSIGVDAPKFSCIESTGNYV